LAKFVSDTTPVNGFELTLKTIKDDRFPKFVGIDPENMFTPRLRFFKCWNSPNQSGMGPSKLLCSKTRCSSSRRFNKALGRCPIKEFKPKSKE